MIKINQEKILNMLNEDDLVLDVGGGACPFNRANYVMDFKPFDDKGSYVTGGLPASQGGKIEYFSRETWIQFDICSRQPWPFKDKQFDFVICSHVLEDLRDPIWVCSELCRVAKAGYVEFPSRMWESTRGWEHDNIAGLSHHRWLCEIEANHIKFTPKYHMIHASIEHTLPWWFNNKMTEIQKNAFLFWKNKFSCEEIYINDLADIKKELRDFISSIHQPNFLALTLERFQLFVRRIYKGVCRRTIYRSIHNKNKKIMG